VTIGTFARLVNGVPFRNRIGCRLHRRDFVFARRTFVSFGCLMFLFVELGQFLELREKLGRNRELN
jgi:hypothetical protein